MLALLGAFFLLALAFWRLLWPSSSTSRKRTNRPDDKPSALSKILEEAFEHVTLGNDEEDAQQQPVLILYATEYGFAAQVARHVASTLADWKPDLTQINTPKLIPRVVNVLHYPVVDFTRERFVALICSTTGDGVPPNEAASFRDALEATDVVFPRTARFSVLALGDRAYPHFCRAGAIFDTVFPDACRLLPRVDVDQEDWGVINNWADSLRDAIISTYVTSSLSPFTNKDSSRVSQQEDYLRAAIEKYAATLTTNVAQYTWNNPFLAKLSRRKRLTSPATLPGHKEVVRVEIDISNSGLNYEVGDALAIVPRNNSVHVNRVLRTLAANGDELVHIAENDRRPSLEHSLTELLDIATVHPSLIVLLARFSSEGSEVNLARRILGYDPRDPTRTRNATNSVSEFGRKYLTQRDVVNVLTDFPSATVSPQQVVDVLRPLHARYYSISSTPKTHPDSIAITVDVLRYMSLGMGREGVASTFLQDRCRINETPVPVFLSRNPRFRLPVEGSVPIVMIGPGTGIAPFVAFVEERIATDASGDNWLFFGCRFENQDFLYREQMLQWADKDIIRLHTAFSRDGPEKVYVQHRMHECGQQLWSLIENEGVHVYVCGDGSHMANDVEKALQEIIIEHGARSAQEAISYLNHLSKTNRYQKDIWVA